MSSASPGSPDPSDDPRRKGEADAWSAFSLVTGGVLFWGGVGWLLTEWLGSRLFVMGGLLLGMGGGLYLVWLRYGRA
jgi:ATP synthase protein I